MSMTVVVTRNVSPRIRGFLASSMLELAPGVYSATRLNTSVRDRMWTEIIRRVSAGGSDEWPHTPEELDSWNQQEVAKLSHLGPARTLVLLGEARAEWNGAMMSAPDGLVADERYRTWAWRRFRHDRHHLRQIQSLYSAWRARRNG